MLSKIPKKTLIFFLIIFVAVFVFYEFYPQKGVDLQEKKERAERVLGRPVDDTVADFTLGQKYKGEHFSLSFHNVFKVYDRLEKDQGANVLESLRIDSEEPRMTLTVIVTDTGGVSNVGEIPAVSVRRANTLFSEGSVKINDIVGINFKKKVLEEGQQYVYESASFLISNGKIYSFVFGSKDAELGDKLVAEILNSVSFVNN